MGLSSRWVGEDRACPQSAGSVFHAPDKNCAKLASIEPSRCTLHRCFSRPADVGGGRHGVVDEVGIVPAQVHVAQAMPLQKPTYQSIALQQITERSTGRHALVAHGREYEDFINWELFGENTIKAHIGENTAGKTKVASFVSLQQPRNRA